MTQMDKPVMQYSTRLLKGASVGRGLLAALLLLLPAWCGTAHAFGLLSIPGVYIPQTYLKIGAAYTRAIVPGPNGRPVYVEFNTSGKEAAEIGEATGPLERAKVMPAGTYRAYLQRLSDARQRYPDSQVMKASEYRGKTFKTVTGETIKKPSISMSSLTVLVRADEQLFSTDGKELLLLELPIKSDVQPSSSSQSLLLSEQGDILHQTANTIGYRVGFHGKDGKVNENLGRDRESQIYGPLAGVPIRLWHEGGTTTGEDGRYVMPYMLPPCPGFSIEYKTDAYLELYYKRFNPRGKSYLPYYIVRPDWDFCTGFEVYSWLLMGIKLSMAMPAEPNLDFPLDLMVIDGAATLRGAKLGGKTEYSSETGERDHRLQEKYDFDGDEKPDWAVPGKKVKKEIDGEEREVFVKTSLEEAELQGIYLSSRYESVPADTEETGPDFTRLIDTSPDFQDRALLETISEDDLRDTDIYVFRESNGQLVAERRGLHESELYKNYSGVDSETGSFRFTIHLRGEKEGIFSLWGIDQGGKEFTKWQSAGGFKEEFQKRNANHLKPGEMVRIIAINRPTGYMGSLRYQLESADVSSGYMGFTGQQIEMSPPNLKVWAERKNKIEQGATKGEEKKQLIGNEGAGLGSDISIAIYTDWLDVDGTPLPEELADYGYTGRLAKIVAANQLAPVGANNLSQFQIKPGQHVQVIQLPEKVLAKQHLYLQVAGQPTNRNPDFSSGGGSGILQYRPSKFVPVMVPLHDEEASELARQAWSKAKKENPEREYKKPEPLYSWVYRPELQFSLYDLNVNSLRRDTYVGEMELIGKDNPSISAADNKLTVLFDFIKSEFSELTLWGGEKAFVFDLGGREIKATLGKSGQVEFDDLSYISSLAPDDFLSLRLLSNGDAGNILWEWSVNTQIVVTPDNYRVSANTAERDLLAYVLLSEEELKQEGKKIKLLWSVSGPSGKLESVLTDVEGGLANNKITTSRRAGDSYSVKVVVAQSDYKRIPVGTEKEFGPYIVEAYVPDRVELTASKDEVLASGVDTVKLTAKVWDKYGNAVADGTRVDWGLGYSGELIEEQLFTQGGVATAIYVAGQEAIPTDVSATAGAVTAEKSIAKVPFQFSVHVSKGAISYDSNETSIITITANRAPEKAIDLALSTTKGVLSGPTTYGGGAVRATLYASAEPGEGDVRVGMAGDEKIISVLHKAEAGKLGIVFDQAALSSKASASVERLNGGSVVYAMPQSATGTVYGPANTDVIIRAGSFYAPNSRELLHLDMVGIDSAQVGGQDQRVITSTNDLYQAVVNSIEAEIDMGQSYTMPGASLHLGSGYLSLANAPALEVDESFFLNARFRANPALLESAAEIYVLRKLGQDGGEVFSLRLIPDSGMFRVVARVVTEGGEYEVTSSTKVSPEQWVLAGIRYDSGQLQVDVDGKTEFIAAAGAIKPQGVSGAFIFGEGFIGHLDDIKFGKEGSGSRGAVVLFEDGSTVQQIRLDANGLGHVSVKLAEGFDGRMLRVGFSVLEASKDGVTVRKDIKVMNDFYSRLTGLVIDSAIAESLQKVDRHEGGIAVADSASFSDAINYMREKGGAAFDYVQAAGKLIYEISGLSDLYTIGNALYLIFNGRWDEVDKMELAFAAISLTLTIVTVVVSGGAGAVAVGPLRASLAFLKAFLKELVMDPVALLKAGGSIFKYTANLVVKFFREGGRAVVKEISALGDALKGMLSSAGRASLQLFMATVRSMRDLKNFLELKVVLRRMQGLQCPLAQADILSGGDAFYLARLSFLTNIEWAEAAPPAGALCGSQLESYILTLRKQMSDQKGGIFFDDVVSVVKTLADSQGKLSVSRESLDTLKRLSETGNSAAVKNILEAMRDGRLKPHPLSQNPLDDMSEAAVISGQVQNFSSFDYMMKLFDYGLRRGGDPKDFQALLKHLEPNKNAEITGYQYKRLIGELKGAEVMEDVLKSRGVDLQFVRANDIVASDDFGRLGKQGVDAVYKSEKYKDVYGEFKNMGAASGAKREESLARLDNQFVKHMEENVVGKLQMPGCTWKNGNKPPFLQYVVMGGFFKNAQDVDAVKKRFVEKLAKSPTLKNLAECFEVKPGSAGKLSQIFDMHWDPIEVKPFIQ
ncbi:MULTISPECIES: hypothetical protein [unclassified Pseudomonas]|uniref:hypothetical protein n=1 Tax=unclassified Pseudomonas TaxID=196821 RepID=UPI002449D746|nr:MULTISPECIES: hypothetical protein [unclassified Pseudomonas]MDG9925147.1 hypothetical protein [Pseudomonas sp. GD04045]MDH0035277.1 hypothetical protein [Pseudomonas sp. GD04019]